MMFSVVIPVYNKEAYIKETIESVLNQEDEDYELILVDDGSTDNSMAIAESITSRKISIIRKPNGGVSSARNAGIRAAKGEYISFLDADDTWSPDYLKTIRGLVDLYGDQAGAFFTAYQIKTSKGVVVPDFRKVYRGRASGILEDYISSITGRYAIANSSCITVRKSMFDLIGFYNEKNPIGEDLEIQLKLAMATSYAFSTKICSEYNRMTTDNARTRNRVFFPQSYLDYIETLLVSDLVTKRQKQDLTSVMNRKYVPYSLTLILAREKDRVKDVLKHWRPRDKYFIYKTALYFCIFLPNGVLRFAQSIYYGA